MAPGDVADQVPGPIDPRLVDVGFEFAAAHLAHRVLLAARAVGAQQFLQQLPGQLGIPVHHGALPTIGDAEPPRSTRVMRRGQPWRTSPQIPADSGTETGTLGSLDWWRRDAAITQQGLPNRYANGRGAKQCC